MGARHHPYCVSPGEHGHTCYFTEVGADSDKELDRLEALLERHRAGVKEARDAIPAKEKRLTWLGLRDAALEDHEGYAAIVALGKRRKAAIRHADEIAREKGWDDLTAPL